MPARVTINGERAELYVPLAKFDERTGEFEAWSTVEELDRHGEICDVEKSWPALAAAAQEQAEISGGKSVGTLRRQHRRDLVIGKLTSIERADRDGKDAVRVMGLVTDPQSKSDAALGVLTGISIRGLAERWDDEQIKGAKRYAWTLAEEQSMVDRPAVPHALIEVMKSSGEIEMVKAVGRPVTQYWDCLNPACQSRHSRKEEAQKCENVDPEETVPTKIEASAKAEESPIFPAASACPDPKAHETVQQAPAVDQNALLEKCLGCAAQIGYLINAVNEEREEGARDAGDEGHEPIAEAATQKLWDALRVLVNDLRAQWMKDEGVSDDMPMDAMKGLDLLVSDLTRTHEVIKSLRVPSGNGSSNRLKEGTMDNETKEEQKGQTAAPANGTEGTGDGELAKSVELLKAQVAELAARPDTSADVAKALGTLTDTVTALAAKVDELGAIKKSHDDLEKAFETYVAATQTRKGVLIPAAKENDGAEAEKSEAPKNVWATVERIA